MSVVYLMIIVLKDPFLIKMRKCMRANLYVCKQQNELSRIMRKLTFCICENKDADQLRGDREADQRLCFLYIDSTIPLLSKSKNFMLLAIICSCKACLSRTRSETRMLVFTCRGSIGAAPRQHEQHLRDLCTSMTLISINIYPV